MEDALAAVPAAPEPIASPTPEPAAQPAAKVETAEPAKPAFERTPRGAVERAMAKLNGEPTRDTGGRFMGKPGEQQATTPMPQAKAPATAEVKPATPEPAKPEPFHEAPARFSADAKAAWTALPDAVKAETHRALRELEGGITKYKSDADAFDTIRDFDKLAKDSGTNIRAAMENYVGIETMLRSNPVQGLARICDNMGLSLVDLARHIVDNAGEPGEGQGDVQDPQIKLLLDKIATLEGQVGTVTSTFAEQHHQATRSQVDTFAAQKEHSRFEELAGDIAKFLKSAELVPANLSPLQRLSEAYKLAERLNPAPAAPVIATTQVANPDPRIQTQRASLSVTGAPGNGSDPTARKPGKSSIRDSIRNARAAIG